MPPRLTITDVALSRAVDHDRSVSLEARTPDGRLVGTALARRAPMAIAYFEALEQGMPPVDYADELNRVAFLDHVEVAEAERRTGVATRLLAELEGALAARGTRVVFGGIGRGDSVATAAFFERRGFQVLQTGQRLPGFFGRRWTLPHAAEPHNWVFARLPRAGSNSG
jgi:GNAT superfamily N-acetyltransferase